MKDSDPTPIPLSEFNSQQMKCAAFLTDWLLDLVASGDRADVLETLQRLADMTPNLWALPRTQKEAEAFEMPDDPKELMGEIAQAVSQIVQEGFLPRMMPHNQPQRQAAPDLFREIEMNLRPETVTLA